MIEDFFKGIAAYGKAFRMISEMKLWKFMLVPGLISLLIGGLTFASAWGFSDNLGQLLFSLYPWEIGRNIMAGFSNLIGGLIIGAIGLVGFKHIVLVLVSPFMSPLSQHIEEQMMGQSSTYKGFNAGEAIKDIARGLSIAFRNIFKELIYTLLLLILGAMIPVIGIFSSVIIFFIQAYYAGFGNMDYTLERHFGVKASSRFVKENKMLALGNGTVFMGLLLTGVGILVAPALATIAATTETVPRLDSYQLLQEKRAREDYV